MAISLENYIPALKAGATFPANGFSVTNGSIIVGDSNGVGAVVAISGDATLANTGALTIASAAITRTKMSAPAGSKQAAALVAPIDTAAASYLAYIRVPESGTLASLSILAVSTLATSDSNYITFTVTNKGQAGAGTAVMLAATAANTTKVTGGSAITLGVVRNFTLTATGADLAVVKGDVLLVTATVTGTLANAVNMAYYTADFSGTT